MQIKKSKWYVVKIKGRTLLVKDAEFKNSEEAFKYILENKLLDEGYTELKGKDILSFKNLEILS